MALVATKRIDMVKNKYRLAQIVDLLAPMLPRLPSMIFIKG
jgi:hypothetical protein